MIWGRLGRKVGKRAGPAAVAAAALAASLLVAPRTDACSGSLCNGPGWLVPESGQVPENATAFLWVPSDGPDPLTVTAADVTFLDLTGGGEVQLGVTVTELSAGTYWIEPAQPLQAGTPYRLTGASFCNESGQSFDPVVAELSAGASALLPTGASLGSLVLEPVEIGNLQVATWSGACEAYVTASQLAFAIDLSPEAAPWADLLLYETLVDGQPWAPVDTAGLSGMNYYDPPGPGESWTGRGRDVVYTICHTDDDGALAGVQLGAHTIQLLATLTGHPEINLASDEVGIELSCDTAGGGAGGGAGGAGGGGDGPLGVAPTTTISNCGCRFVGGEPSAAAWLALLVLAGLSRARRRQTCSSR
jgi:MYXO-CTERM domain-containing protein